jgi:L-lactate dehydrogenase (cytochrome)
MCAAQSVIQSRTAGARCDVPLETLDELRAQARRRLPKSIFDFIEGGAFSETTLRDNLEAFSELRLSQRVLVDVSSRSMATVIAGSAATMPTVLAPTGFMGFVWPDGEIEAKRAAHAAGIPMCLSVLSVCPLERVAEAGGAPWFQIYPFRDQGVNDDLIARARAAACPVLMVTLDLHMEGRRNRDLVNGLLIPPRPRLALDLLSRPRWLFEHAIRRRDTLGTLSRYAADGDLGSVTEWVAKNLSGAFDRRDLDRVRQLWPGKLVVKGILDAGDAEVAADAGVDAIVVSNHGGRQLDGAITSVEAIQKIRERLGGRVELMLDSGIRSGLDVLKALGIGARATLIGRPFLYGLGAYGEAGVCKVLEIFRAELDIAMALVGVSDLRALPQGLVLTLQERGR